MRYPKDTSPKNPGGSFISANTGEFHFIYITLLMRVIECILRKTARGGARLPQTLRGRPPPRIQDWDMEVSTHAFDMDALCDPRG